MCRGGRIRFDISLTFGVIGPPAAQAVCKRLMKTKAEIYEKDIVCIRASWPFRL